MESNNEVKKYSSMKPGRKNMEEDPLAYVKEGRKVPGRQDHGGEAEFQSWLKDMDEKRAKRLKEQENKVNLG